MADIYEEAAKCLVECIGKKCMTLKFPDDKIQELTKERNIFRDEYSPDALRKLPKDDKETLWKLFITSDGKKDNLDNVLENKTHDFGAITVYSASDYGLYRGKDGFWFTVEKGGMSDEQALPIGIKIRDEIVLCCEKIEERINGGQLSTVQDYEDLQEDLTDIIGQNLVKMAWLRKYFYINFPQYFVNWYKEDFLEEFLYGLGIIPTNKLYGKIGQLVMVKKCIDGLVSIFGTMEFMNGCFSLGFLKKFYILNTNAVEMETVAYMSQNGIVGLACDPKQNLGSFAELGKKYTKTLLKKKLKQSSFDITFANDCFEFYKLETSGAVVAVISNGLLVGFVDFPNSNNKNKGNTNPGYGYHYEPSSPVPHQRAGVWHVPEKKSQLPKKEELYFKEASSPNNLLFLAKMYFRESLTDELSNGVKYRGEKGMEVEINGRKSIKTCFKYNRILFGAPGTGKSYMLNLNKNALLGIQSKSDEAKPNEQVERVIFYPDYSYANFVGTYKPVSYKDAGGNDSIKYIYVPGPFMRTYIHAWENIRGGGPVKPYVLIIEEINRSNAAAVFGDMFQLLDRDEAGYSEYSIQASEDIRRYLEDKKGIKWEEDDCKELRLPGNMFIWATMNSADQGVFPMDTAFKRRWSFEYLDIDEAGKKVPEYWVALGRDEYAGEVEWQSLRMAINEWLADNGVNEDKQIGPYFITGLRDDVSEAEKTEKFNDVFTSKVIMYLFEDAAKQRRYEIFSGCDNKNRYSCICKDFREHGIRIFNEDIQNKTKTR